MCINSPQGNAQETCNSPVSEHGRPTMSRVDGQTPNWETEVLIEYIQCVIDIRNRQIAEAVSLLTKASEPTCHELREKLAVYEAYSRQYREDNAKAKQMAKAVSLLETAQSGGV